MPEQSKPPKRTEKAYYNKSFLSGPDARIVRLMCEYLEPLGRFRRHSIRDTIVMFGSARARPREDVERRHQEALAERKKYGRSAPKELRERLQRIEWDLSLSRFYDDAMELSRLLTTWAQGIGRDNRFVICSGGGPGIMEAANRGATLAGGPSIGLSISLPSEEAPNPYITPEFLFEFHYFFMRKLWFVYMSAALIVFPGGFGTMDELFEVLTLIQTRKINRPLPIVLYGGKFWKDVLNLDALVRWGTINRSDLELYRICNTPREAFDYLKSSLTKYYPKPVPGKA